jgi:protein phosphatase
MHDISYFSLQGKNKLNQDAILHYSYDENNHLIAIADGMGGKKGGNIASNYVLNIIEELYKNNININIKELFQQVSQNLITFTQKLPEFKEMATTLTVCIIKDNFIIYGHVGDCRIYHLRNEGIVSKTKDQTELQELLDKKVINKYNAKLYHRKNILLSVMSSSNLYTLEDGIFEIQKGDRIMLLSDGVYNVIRNKKYIRNLSIESSNVNIFTEKIKSIIETTGILDDYSCITIEIK